LQAVIGEELAARFWKGTEIMEFTAKARFMRVSPQKARLVLDLIKGLRVEQALNTLAFTNKRVAPLVHKLLRSAIENANYMNTEKGVEVDVDRLFVKRAIANDGPRMKRVRPAPMGRAYRYQRRMAHLEIAVAEKPAAAAAAAGKSPAAPVKKAVRKPAAKKAPAKKASAKKAPARKAPAKKKK
jgi:large subunit ribosomal protein L22